MEDVAHPDLGRMRTELVAATRATCGDDQPGLSEARHELLQVGAGKVLVQRDLREAGRPCPVAAPELDHEPHAVLTLRAEGDGAGTVEACALCQGGVLVGRSKVPREVARGVDAAVPGKSDRFRRD